MNEGRPAELAALRTRLAEVHHLDSAASLLWWDQNVCMPPAGAAARAEGMAALERVAHEKLVHPEVARLLDALEAHERDLDPESDDARYLARARRDHLKAACVPGELAAAMAEQGALGDQAWRRAREADDFALLRGSLERQIDLRRQYAACFPGSEHPYDVLLDDYEEGATVARLGPLFEELRAGLRPLVASGSEIPDPAWRGRPFPLPAQRAFVRDVLDTMGFDEQRFRLDESPHPFSQSPGVGDHRITTRYSEDNLAWALHSALHEFGHGLYESQLDSTLGAGPLLRHASLGVHESQSRLWENQVGHSMPFCRWVLPLLRKHFDGFDGLTPEDLFRPQNGVKPSLVRTEADETTYNLHIVLRVELEIRLVEGSLEVDRLPEAWDEGMQRLLGIVPATPREGVLQDIHWPSGLFGYFATYTLGNLMAAQLWERIRVELPQIDDLIERGDLAPLREWLGERIHRPSRRLPPRELLQRATGEGLRVEPLVDYLGARLAEAGAIPAAA